MRNKVFVEKFQIEPYQSGALDGLTFAVKDNIDIKDYKTSCGNPAYRDVNPLAKENAVCVESLLATGATCVGKTVCGEFGFGLTGMNHCFGTPINPNAPDYVPGGSSSGSAVAVAAKEVDFALGTDAGGSIRAPASYCGVYGMRPSWGTISSVGVHRVSPIFETIGVFANSLQILTKVMSVFVDIKTNSAVTQQTKLSVNKTVLNIVDASVQKAFLGVIELIKTFFPVEFIENSMIDDQSDDPVHGWNETFKIIIGTEMWNTVGKWAEAAGLKLGATTHIDFSVLKNMDKTRFEEALSNKEKQSLRINHFLDSQRIMCFPTAPHLPPKLTDVGDAIKDTDYRRMRALHCISGLGGLPQISLPLANVNGVPVGVSLLAAHGNDAYLLQVAEKIVAQLRTLV